MNLKVVSAISYACITSPGVLRKPACIICIAYCSLGPLDVTVKLYRTMQVLQDSVTQEPSDCC